MRRCQPRTLAIMVELLELKNAFAFQLRDRKRNPALVMMYAFIDICASLVKDGQKTNPETFRACVDSHAMMAGKPFNSYDLWAARCALLHAYSPMGDHTKPGGAKAIFYYGWDDNRAELDAIITARGYRDYILLDIEAIQWVAIDSSIPSSGTSMTRRGLRSAC